jgi:DNA polymerase-3 subunit gamma/tau
MSYEVFARKWRPQKFQDVIAQEQVTRTLINAVRSGRLAHAYLFAGPRGVGKTSVARILAKAVNCQNGELGNPCDDCTNCHEITDGSSVDVQEIDGASNRGIDEIRELRENIKYMPSSSRYRVYIIDEVHMLTLQAFNALLKTLEEPPAHVKFIFATTEAHKVPVTILSRCQKFDFKRIPVPQIVDHLKKIAAAEGIQISQAGLNYIAKEAEGGMRDAESLLDQVVSFAGGQVTEKNITEILGIIDRDLISETSRAVIEGDAKKCLEIVDRTFLRGYDFKEFHRALMEQFRNLLVGLIASEALLLDTSEVEREEIRQQAAAAGTEKLQVLLNFLVSREPELRLTSNPRFLLETTLIKLCHMGDFLSFSALLQKIDALEKKLTGYAASATKPNSGQVPEKITGSEANRPETGSDPASPTELGQRKWEDFLRFLSSKNKSMYNIIKDWHPAGMHGEIFELERGGSSFSAAYFDDPEHFKELLEHCRNFFQADLRLRIVGDKSPLTRTQNQSRPGRQKPKTVPQDIPAGVREILNVFEGEIHENENNK